MVAEIYFRRLQALFLGLLTVFVIFQHIKIKENVTTIENLHT